VVVNVRFPPVFLVRVAVGDMNMVQCRMVVLVRVSGQQMTPVLSPMQVVRNVIVLVTVLQGLMLVVPLRPGHLAHLPSRQAFAEKRTVHL
jgi:hypothetical protein